MGKRKELSLDEKVSLVEECLTGRLRMREAARRAGVGHSTMESWISRYRSEGISALEENGNQSKRRYDEDFKRKVVKAYMSGQGSSPSLPLPLPLSLSLRLLPLPFLSSPLQLRLSLFSPQQTEPFSLPLKQISLPLSWLMFSFSEPYISSSFSAFSATSSGL